MFLSVLAFGLFLSSAAFAQNSATAQISADVETILLPDGPLAENYEVYFSNWSQQDAQKIANHLDEKSAIISLEVDYPNSKLLITLDLDAPEANNWGFEEWKHHLLNL